MSTAEEAPRLEKFSRFRAFPTGSELFDRSENVVVGLLKAASGSTHNVWD
jgi:hypothetical protein